jgi:eukaryotic-like serine/threonine-protein kinase
MLASVERVRPPEAQGRCPLCEATYPADYRLCPRDGTPLGPRDASADPLVGLVLGGTFRLLRPLARGGMARLYEAEHLRVDRRFAVKVLAEGLAERPELLQRFEREARALAPIRSPHVVEVVDVLRTPDGRPCIVTGLLRGEDLGRRLAREGTLPLPEALQVAMEMCRGLDATHAHGVVHRDLKPSNVFLAGSPDGHVTVKLVDFGVAKLLFDPALTHSDAVVGTPAYMPPEQARAASRATEASDVYGVGAVLYHMLGGRPPYEGTDATDVLTRVLTEEPARLGALAPGVPREVEAVVQAAMARDPDARVRGATDLHALLADLALAHGKRRDDGEPTGVHLLSGREGATGDTQILPRGITGDTHGLVQRAARARPLTLWTAAVAALGMALAAAVLMGAALAGLDVEPGSRAHRWLTRGATLVAGALGAWLLVRGLRGAWRSAVAVEALRQRWTAALRAGATVLGACVGVMAGSHALSGEAPIVGAGTLAMAVLTALAVGTWAVRRPPPA